MQTIMGFETILPCVSVMYLVSSSVLCGTLTKMQTLMGFETILPCVSVIHLVIGSVVLPQCWDNG